MRNNETHPITYIANGISLTVLRNKIAKAIINRCYEADKSSVIATDGMAVHGNSIVAIAVKCSSKIKGTQYNIAIISTVFEQSTLASLLDEVFAALNAHKVN